MQSTMDLQVNGDNVDGDYTSSNSEIGTGGPVVGSLRGWVKGDLISFTVLSPGGSMTAWTGQMAGDRIVTLWQLVTDVPDSDEPTKLWTSTLADADEFFR